MQSSCPSPRKSRPLLPLLLTLLAAALVPPTAAACPVLGPGADPQTKAYLAPLVFHGTLTAQAKRGPAIRATFRVDRALKGHQQQRPDNAVVEFAVRENPARCRGATLAGIELVLHQRYIVFAAWRRKKMIAVATPEDYSKRKAVSRVLCDKCAKAPSVRNLKDTTLEVHSKLKLKCRISGNPPPRVTWFKNGHRIKSNSRIKIKSKRRFSHLVINKAITDDSGDYECRAVNVLGNATATASVVVSTESTTDSTLWPFKKGPCPRKNFCLNGGICSYYEVVREYVCECAEGYRGQRCESKAISTLSSPSPVDPPKAPHDMDATTRLLQHYWGR